MNIKACIKKEFLDGIRNYRFLVIVVSFLFFAILDPVMSKFILPEIMKSQFPGLPEEALASLMDNSQIGIIRTYLNDVFQIGMLVVILTLSGVVAQEINQKTIIFPVTSGKKFHQILISKFIVYGIVLMVSAVFCAMVNYLYTGVLFGFDMTSPVPVLRAGFLQGFYMLFLLSLLMLVGSMIKKPMVAGLIVLIPAWFMGALGNLLNINRYLPSELIAESQLLSVVPSSSLITSIISTIVLSVLAFGFTVIRLRKSDLAWR